jgi:hypothetical protein
MKLKGTVKGQTIVFDEPIGLPEGRRVEADLEPIETASDLEQYGIRPFPPGDYVVTNDIVNEIRDELGI